MNSRLRIFPVMAVVLMLTGGLENPVAQVVGELAEMDRLEQRAQDLTAQSDPEGASQAFGKAAMMADLLSRETQNSSTQAVFQAASLLYRAQERGLRAMALFERTGGQPPAPAGVCHFLSQSIQELDASKGQLEHNTGISQENLKERRRNLFRKTHDWKNLFQGLQDDFACVTD